MIRKFFLVMGLCLVFSSVALAYEAKVVAVADGDTITVLYLDKQVKIRLYGIDCPEKKQAFGNRAKQYTSQMVHGKTVEVTATGKDRYGRTIAWVAIDGKSLNESLVAAGLAWHYKKYSSDQNLADAETKARNEKIGLWSDPHAMAPWQFRHAKKKKPE